MSLEGMTETHDGIRQAPSGLPSEQLKGVRVLLLGHE
jgi:hypothetical protein